MNKSICTTALVLSIIAASTSSVFAMDINTNSQCESTAITIPAEKGKEDKKADENKPTVNEAESKTEKEDAKPNCKEENKKESSKGFFKKDKPAEDNKSEKKQ